MHFQMETAAPAPTGPCPVSIVVLQDGRNDPEPKASLRDLQAARLIRLCAINRSLAFAVCPFLHGESA
jgi:hypothetical protein